MTSSQYAAHVLDEISEHKYDTAEILRIIKSDTEQDLKRHEAELVCQLSEVRTRLHNLQKA